MSTEIKVPTLGESVTTATVARWLKKAGEPVAVDEPVVELETDKVTVEVPAPGAGMLGEIMAPEGAEVSVGAVLALLEAAVATPRAPAPAALPSAGVNPPPPARGPVARPAMPSLDVNPAPAPAPAASAHAPMPSAAKLIEERKIEAGDISGSGKNGRITKGDVLAFVARPAPVAAAAAP